MPPLPLALPPQSNQGDNAHSGVAALINCYAVPRGDEQKSKLSIMVSAGLDALATLATSGGIRGMIDVDGVADVVAGRTVFQVDAGGNAVLLGGLASDGYVGMDRNQRGTGVQTAVVCDGVSKCIVGGSMTQITDPDLPPANDVCVINRSAVYSSADGRMTRSEIDDLTSINGLDQARAEAVPDVLYRVMARGSELLAFGSRSVEIWQDRGGEAFGFSRNTWLNSGVVGPSSVVKGTVKAIGDAAYYLATNKDGLFTGVAMLASNTPTPISTAFIENKIKQVADKSSIVATSWVERAHAFIGWRLEDTTVVYDTSTGLWHERQSRDPYGNLTAWRVGLTTGLGGRVLAGHVSLPKLYWLDPDTEDEDGDELIMRPVLPPLSAYPGRVEINRVYLDIVPGVGQATGSDQDTNPEIAMRLSRDGRTWGTERRRKLGAQGARMTQVFWSGLGTHPQATLEFTVSAAVVREILSASWEGRALPP